MNDHADTLRKIRATIADEPLECLGIGQADGRAWPIRDEVVHALDKIIAALEAGRSADWVLVPREATVEMVAAAREAGAAFGFGHHYAKAIAAAPQQPTGRSGEAGELKVVAEVRDTDGRVQTVWLGYHITDFVGQRLYAVPPTKDANNG